MTLSGAGKVIFVLFCSFTFSWLHHRTRGILVPGSNSRPLHWKQGALTTGIAEKTPCVALDEELSALIQVLFSLTVHILL